jgi:glucose-1-phosphate thymidylyltransferase
MKAIIPAAGIGKRLKPLTLTRPKVLLPVAGKPILGYILDSIEKSGIEDIVLIIGYKKEQIIDYIKDNYNLNFTFVVQEERKGLGHAVGLGLDYSNEPALVILGDTIFNLNISEFINREQTTLGVMEVPDPERFGIVEEKNGWVTKFLEKPENPNSNLAIIGIYFFDSQKKIKEAIDYIIENDIKTKGEYQLTDALQVMLENGTKIKIEKIEQYYDCGTRETLLNSNRFLMDIRNCEKVRNFPDSVIIPPVYIHQDVNIKKSIIGPYTSIGKDVLISNSFVENSIVIGNTKIKNAILRDSIIGENASIEGRFLIGNFGDYSHLSVK